MPQLAQLVEILQRYAHEHPLVSYARCFAYPHAFRTSDVISLRQYRNLGVYHDFYGVHVMGVNRQMAFIDTPSPSLTLGVSLNRRGRDFRDGHRSQLEMLRPHLLQAYGVARAHAQIQERERQLREDVATTVSGGLCQLDQTGRMGWMTAAGEGLLTRYFPEWKPNLDRLPPTLFGPLRTVLNTPRKKTEVAPTGTQKWSFPRGFGTLTVRLAARLLSGEWQILFMEETPDPSAEMLAARHGLSRRVAETLFWLGQGKTNEEIGIILHISTLTVKEYVARVLGKLDVPNRTAAARVAVGR